MKIGLLKGIIAFAVLLLVQVLVFNHIHLFNCATPLLYVYMPMLFSRNNSRWVVLLLSFFMGMAIDVFQNTPGVAMATMTFIGLIQPLILGVFMQQDSEADIVPSMRTLGVAKFSYYSFIITFLYCLVFFTLETFTFFNWLQWLETVGASTLLTYILILVLENLRRS
ncbi:MAG: rod shape-determining protein MreD [Prevotella sp.]|nr:rod shape-determining protein MreD [Prevotella sp.]